MKTHRLHPPIFAALVLLALGGVTGCADDVLGPGEDAHSDPFDQAIAKGIPVIERQGGEPPAGIVSFAANGRAVACWPYTGATLAGTPSDPVNLVFTGEADPVSIREALLALDGDRTAWGFPPVYPFDQRWTDCIGGSAQATWAASAGWTGGAVQLTVGDFEPLRIHLRLFPVDNGLTLAAAHFEVLIPGTADHQVLSWELAEQLVVADLVRAGVIDPAAPPTLTGTINAAPSFRTIPAAVYNALPPELAALSGGPAPPVTTDVPLASDGQASLVTLAGMPAPRPCRITLDHTANYDQFVPRPFCSSGPADWLHVSGAVHFAAAVSVDHRGRFTVRTGYEGDLTVTPVDPTTGQVLAAPFPARVRGHQRGQAGSRCGFLLADDRMITHEAGGPQITFSRLSVRNPGRDRFRGFVRCLDAEDP